MTSDGDSAADLRAENARLVALLVSHGIEWPKPAEVEVQPAASALSTDQKITLFRRLFLGRTDVYPMRWESKAGKTGYAPACANEWRAGVCEKPRIKCADCGHRSLIALTDRTIFDHLAGRHTTGVYPLLTNDTCNFLAVDFDDAEWREDAKGFAKSCSELGVPMALEVSRSGEGAHAWVFLSASVAARDARRLGTALISFTCARTRQLKLTSYDRLFPSQDTLPKGGFGNLIALPLQKLPREWDRSVFVDEALQPFPDQWAFLTSVTPMGAARHRAHDSSRHRGLTSARREGTAAAIAGEPPGASGRLPEPGVLPCASHTHAGVGQAARHRLRREFLTAHRPASWVPGGCATTAAGPRHSLRSTGRAVGGRTRRS